MAVEQLGAPVAAYGDASLTCATWYNCLWEAAHVSGDFNPPSNEVIDSVLDDLSQFLTVVLYLRWSKIADVDLEPSLEKRIAHALSEHDVTQQKLPVQNFPRDHNSDDMVFEDSDLLSEWLGDALHRAATNLSRESDDDFLYMYSARYPKSKPMFKASGWDLAVSAVRNHLGIASYCARKSCVRYYIVEGVGTSDGFSTYKDDFPYFEVTSARLDEMITNGDVSPLDTQAVLVSNDADDEGVWDVFNALLLLSALHRLPENVNQVLALSRPSSDYAKQHCIDFCVQRGLPLLFDFSAYDPDDRVPSLLGDEIAEANSGRVCGMLMGEFDYTGPIDPPVRKRISELGAVRCAELLLNDINVGCSYLASLAGVDVRDTNSYRTQLTSIVKELSFDRLDISDIAIDRFDDRHTNTLLCPSQASSQLEKDLWCMRELYSERGLLSRTEQPDDGPPQDNSLADVLRLIKTNAEEQGLDVLISALDHNIPLSDAVCGMIGRTPPP